MDKIEILKTSPEIEAQEKCEYLNINIINKEISKQQLLNKVKLVTVVIAVISIVISIFICCLW